MWKNTYENWFLKASPLTNTATGKKYFATHFLTKSQPWFHIIENREIAYPVKQRNECFLSRKIDKWNRIFFRKRVKIRTKVNIPESVNQTKESNSVLVICVLNFHPQKYQPENVLNKVRSWPRETRPKMAHVDKGKLKRKKPRPCENAVGFSKETASEDLSTINKTPMYPTSHKGTAVVEVRIKNELKKKTKNQNLITSINKSRD